jgi:hypothetical protein
MLPLCRTYGAPLIFLQNVLSAGGAAQASFSRLSRGAGEMDRFKTQVPVVATLAFAVIARNLGRLKANTKLAPFRHQR